MGKKGNDLSSGHNRETEGKGKKKDLKGESLALIGEGAG